LPTTTTTTTTTPTTTPTTTTTTTLPVVTTTTVPGDDLQSLLPLEDEPELQVLLPATGSSTNYFGYMGLLLLSLGMVLLRRKRIAR
jgi:LPXTG-motif cell wall-anchored protein